MCIYNHFNLTHKWWAKRHSACVTHPFDCHQIHWKPEFVEQFACKWDQQTTCALKNTQKSQRRSLNSFYSKFTKIGSILGVELSEIWVINNLLVLNAVKNTLKKSKHNSIGYNIRESYTIDRIIWFELQNIVLSHSAILFSSFIVVIRYITLFHSVLDFNRQYFRRVYDDNPRNKFDFGIRTLVHTQTQHL